MSGEEGRDKKLIVSLCDYNKFLTLPGECLSDSFTRFSLIITRLLGAGAEETVKSNQTQLGGPLALAAERKLPMSDGRASINFGREKDEEKLKAFVATTRSIEVWSSGDEEEMYEYKRKGC
ncbi:hypothetical protein L2E82_06759 [Cichorium intybus]|uniref:Uncharacterized protein n=1 Tax=Cichorium intybus TaxID=13427 RepID=A0ACB9HBQ1_CICIN|nr:hypothetical protein L2E82_06759 [Cichorium intybus]